MEELKHWPLMLDVNQVEQLVGIPSGKMRKWLMLPSQVPCGRKIGGRWYFQKFELLAWLESDLSDLYVP